MLWVLLNFIWIFVSSYFVGLALKKGLVRLRLLEGMSLDLQLMLGLMGLTIYAECVTLVYHTGTVATLILAVLCLLTAMAFRGEWMAGILFLRTKSSVLTCTGGVVLILSFAAIGSQRALFSDTSLYHAQAIRWMEYYGVVPGLGNLHNRLAYNSAFLCLQALFSWHSFAPVSLHGMNAYLGLFTVATALTGLRGIGGRRVRAEDGLCVAGILFTFISLYSLQSPNTDYFALMLVWYLSFKWFRGISEGTLQGEKIVYGLLGVYAVTLKLSAAPLVIFLLIPVVSLLFCRKYKELSLLLLICMMIVLPFCLRNVVISGYLLYPYAALDLFSVDWKMPAELVRYDHWEIIGWGRGINSASGYGMSFTEWFPVWYQGMDVFYRVMFALNALMTPYVLFHLGKHRKENTAVPVLAALAAFAAWLFSAPLIRYGSVFLFLLPSIYAARFLQRHKRGGRAVQAAAWLLAIGCLYRITGMSPVSMRIPEEYGEFACEPVKVGGMLEFWAPADEAETNTGYSYFPTAPGREYLANLGLRGTDLKDGFYDKRAE